MLRWGSLVCALVVGAAAAGCSSLLSAEPTPVPGAAATLTRSVRTPIPTPLRTPEPSPSVGGVASRVAPAGSPSAVPASTREALSDADVARMQQRMEDALASPDLPGIEDLLLDHVSLSTTQGGNVMDTAQTAAWLRAHAAPGISVTGMLRDTQTILLQVQTSGWPTRDPVQQGHLTFSFRRYDATGRLDEAAGQWKIDVIEAE